MSSQSPGGTKSNSDQISTDDDEDKKFVSQAVTFVIGHARNGFVSLCASVASLFKEQTRLKQEVESLQKEVSLSKKQLLKHNNEVEIQTEIKELNKSLNSDLTLIHRKSIKYIPDKASLVKVESLQQETSFSRKQSSNHNSEPEIQAEVNELSKTLNSDSTNDAFVQLIQDKASMTKLSKQIPYRKIKDCICYMCSVNKIELPFPVPLERGMKVIIRGELCGTVEYIGHVEALDFPEIQVGIKFSEAIGNSDGKIQRKVYFSAAKNCGMFVPLSHILCIVK